MTEVRAARVFAAAKKKARAEAELSQAAWRQRTTNLATGGGGGGGSGSGKNDSAAAQNHGNSRIVPPDTSPAFLRHLAEIIEGAGAASLNGKGVEESLKMFRDAAVATGKRDPSDNSAAAVAAAVASAASAGVYTTAGAEIVSYLRSLKWNLVMYRAGQCPDQRWTQIPNQGTVFLSFSPSFSLYVSLSLAVSLSLSVPPPPCSP